MMCAARLSRRQWAAKMIKPRCEVSKTGAAKPGSAKWRCRTSSRCETPMSMGKALVEPDHVPPSFEPRSTTLPRRLFLGDLSQVMHYYPPACPSSHPIFTMVGATLQIVLPPEYADASFHAGPERKGPLEPSLLFVFLALLGKTTALWQGHTPDARPLGGLLALL